MARDNPGATETRLWICVSGGSASNHPDADRDRKQVLRLSWSDSLKKDLAQYLPKLHHQRKTADDGGGPREFLLSSDSLEMNLQPWDIGDLLTIAQYMK